MSNLDDDEFKICKEPKKKVKGEKQEKAEKGDKGKKNAKAQKKRTKQKEEDGETSITQQPEKQNKKEKVVAVAKGKQPLIKEDAESLLIYMKDMNRPFTLNYLRDTLHLKAPLLAKNLEQLLKTGDITLKEAGSTKVYLYNQSLLPEINNEEMEQLGKLLDEKNEALKLINSENNKLAEQIRQLQKTLKLNEMNDEISKQKQLISDIDKKIQIYMSEDFQKVPENETLQAEQEFQNMQSECLKKKKIYQGAIDTLLENSELTVKEFEAIIGIYRE